MNPVLHAIRSPKPQAPRRLSNSAMQPRNPRVEQDDDEDLKKALEMSLEDMKGRGSGYVSNQQPVKKVEVAPAQNPAPAPAPMEDEDDELKAAIAASLRDMEVQKARSSWSTPTGPSTDASRPNLPVTRPDHELSPAEAENISLFATLVDRLQTQPPGTILREPQIQELYEGIGALRPKLARTFGETMSKYGRLDNATVPLSKTNVVQKPYVIFMPNLARWFDTMIVCWRSV